MQFQFEKSGTVKALTAEEMAEADKKSSVIVCLHGRQKDGKVYWVYLAVRPSRYAELRQRTTERKPVLFAEYGTILRYGIGAEVPDKIKEEMKQEYGCDDNCLENLKKEVKEQQATFLKEQDKQKTERFQDLAALLKTKQP